MSFDFKVKWPLHLYGIEINKSFENFELNNIFFHGQCDQVKLSTELNKGGVLVLPSISEKWGVVVHELASIGYPLLLSEACGSVFDLLIEGFNGEYVHCLKHFKFSYFISTFTGFSNNISSNAIFWRKKSFNNNMYLNANFKCGLDREFFSRLTHNKVIKHVNITIANYRIQPISKAAINYRDWDGLINHESNLVFHKSYPNLWISKFIGVDFAKKMIFIFLLYRRFQKIFTGRYLIYYLEKRKYSRNKLNKNLPLY